MKEISKPVTALLILMACIGGVSALTAGTYQDYYETLAGNPVEIVVNITNESAIDLEDWNATIYWADGTSESNVPIAWNDGNSFNVTATHTYMAAGIYLVNLSIINETPTDEPEFDEQFVAEVNVSRNGLEGSNFKIVPKSLNMKSQGVMTIFITLTDTLKSFLGLPVDEVVDDGDSEDGVPVQKTIREQLRNMEENTFQFEGANATKVKFNMKDGGTIMLKFKKPEITRNLEPGTKNKWNGTINGTDVQIEDNVKIKNPGKGNGKQNTD